MAQELRPLGQLKGVAGLVQLGGVGIDWAEDGEGEDAVAIADAVVVGDGVWIRRFRAEHGGVAVIGRAFGDGEGPEILLAYLGLLPGAGLQLSLEIRQRPERVGVEEEHGGIVAVLVLHPHPDVHLAGAVGLGIHHERFVPLQYAGVPAGLGKALQDDGEEQKRQDEVSHFLRRIIVPL